ncbi:MAG: hypothetical protein QJR14_06850 [Bacillota bacterium]|nr:hypothetical protein [Bacillota bacterium]
MGPEEGPVGPGDAGAGEAEESLGLEEACERLNIRPYLFRTLARQQPELFRTVVVAGERRVRSADLVAMERFLARRLGGEAEAQGLAAAGAAPAEPQEPASPEARWADLEARVRRLEHLLGEERDQWLVQLARLQQEVRQLRYELAASTPRRARRGFHLFGFAWRGGGRGRGSGPEAAGS